MSIIRVCTFTALALTTAIASAATTQNKGNTSAFSYDYVEGSFGEYDEADADVLYLGGAIGLDKQFAVVGALGLLDGDFGDATILRGGLLFHTPVDKNFDLFGALELGWIDTDFGDDIGFIATGGARVQIQDNFELEGKLTLTKNDQLPDDGLGFSVGARYYLDKQLSAAVGLASETEFDGIWINLRYNLK